MYNNEEYIEKCLNSILNQNTDFVFEIIVGEDDSTDSTRDICKALAERHPDKIRLFLRSEKDKIFYKGRKTSRFNYMSNIYASRGEFIALCDGDDYWISNDKLQQQVKMLRDNKSLVAVHHWQKYAIEQDGVWVEIDAPTGSGYGYCSNHVSTVEQIFKNQMRLKARTLMFRNVVSENFFPNWFTKVAFADVSLSFLLGKYGNYGFLDKDLAVYRQSNSERLSNLGLKELGKKRFKVEHLQNYIEIWDRANIHYKYKYNKETRSVVKGFYRDIIINMPDCYKAYINLLKYNSLIRPLPFYRTFYSSVYLIVYMTPILYKKINRRIRIR
ncbi:hypothetical protein BTO09_10750 [Gilvibacter sp. SZ-19]|nr:hypothetical protein BTO09_10750 [Gilvibacter sp. SZ-19]